MANFEIEDEFGRKFSFVEQDVNDRTAFLEIDYAGNLPLERHQAATNAEFNEDGSPTGVTMQQVMESILGLTFVPEADDVLLDPTDREDADLIDRSYSTRMIGGFETLSRVKGVSRDLTGEEKDWWVITPDGLITPVFDDVGELVSPARDFNSTVVFSDQDFAFKFVQDLDGDVLEADMEAIYRSIDSDLDTPGDPDVPDSRDTDNDGIDDGDEVYGFFIGNKRVGWTIRFDDAQDAYKTFANPGRADTDLDGLTDAQELGLADIQVYLDDDGIPTLEVTPLPTGVPFRLPKPTDPARPDTDSDGLPDAIEVAGFAYEDLMGNDKIILPSEDVDTVFATNPLNQDTDGDGLADLREIQLGTNPVDPDGDTVLDDDGDGLVNLEETTGWLVEWSEGNVSMSAMQPSDPKDPDSDDDGLTDWEEFMGCRDLNGDLMCDTDERFGPTSPISEDTDQDDLTDRAEVDSVDFPSDKETPFRFTDPRNDDTDGDGLTDGTEVNTSWTVQVVGRAAEVVFSDPTDADKDGDGLNDQVERDVQLSNPNAADTDDDGALDGLEATRITNILEPDHLITVFFHTLEISRNNQPINQETDGDDGQNPGDFNFTFWVGVPIFAPVQDLQLRSVVSNETVTVGNCADGNDPGPCRNTSDEIQITSGFRLLIPATDLQGNQFAVPFNSIFTIEGFVQEIDPGGADAGFFFGGVGTPDGTFVGADLEKGTFVKKYDMPPAIIIHNDEPLNIAVTVQVVVE